MLRASAVHKLPDGIVESLDKIQKQNHDRVPASSSSRDDEPNHVRCKVRPPTRDSTVLVARDGGVVADGSWYVTQEVTIMISGDLS